MKEVIDILANNGLAIFLVIVWTFKFSKKIDTMNDSLIKILENITKNSKAEKND